MLNQLKLLACKDPEERRAAMRHALESAHLPYTVQRAEPTPKRLRSVENFLVKLGDAAKPCVLLCAHYDAYAGSYGANDNAAALCILLKLARTLQLQGVTAEFAFFDAEEDKRAGSRLYVEQLEKGSVTAVVNLDLCGYGDTLVLFEKGYANRAAMLPFCGKSIRERHDAKIVAFLPESDDISFRGTHLPTVSVAIVPKWDLQYLKALSTYANGFFGKPPEYEMIMEDMEIMSTLHGGCRDTPDCMDLQAMNRVYEFLLDACTAPISKRFRLFHR